MTLGQQFKEKRLEHEKTQREMAEILGVGTMHYNRYENNKSAPSTRVLQKFANQFRVVLHIYPAQ